jgi:hypothetical protein
LEHAGAATGAGGGAALPDAGLSAVWLDVGGRCSLP